MRIALVISSLSAGGAERVMSTMANYWATRGWEVTLITLSSQADDWYGIHPGVKRVGLNLLFTSAHLVDALRNSVRRVRRLRHELQRSRSDVVISFVEKTNVLTLIACLGLGIPVIVSERVDPRRYPIGVAWGVLRSLLYRHADALVVQSYASRDWARRVVRGKFIHVIPNPVQPMQNKSRYSSNRQGQGGTIVAMGRLTRQKGFDLLIRAFSRCAQKHDDWSLIILGEGEERPTLEALVIELELKDRVSLPGLIQEPTQILQDADVFVLSSRYEGFPNALLEAMVCGLAVIATDCDSGPREIIRDGVNGVLVPPNDLVTLAAAMDRLMTDGVERQRLAMQTEEVLERFSLEKVMTMWNDLLTRTSTANI